jgi:hypothetical protein
MTTVLPVHTEHAAAEHLGLELLPVVQSHMGGSESGVGIPTSSLYADVRRWEKRRLRMG